MNENNPKPLIIIGGPTGVGKTGISIDLAREIGGEIISADSIQVYKGLDIGSAKITAGEMQGIPHHLIDILEPMESFGVDSFCTMAAEAIEAICGRGHIPIIVGGTGFYIRALLYGADFSEEPEHSHDYRKELMEIAASPGGGNILYDRLQNLDPDYAMTVHPNNCKRVIRALEYIKYTGIPFSRYNQEQKAKNPVYNHHFFALVTDRPVLYDNINKRVERMLDNGLLEEVKTLMEAGLDRSCLCMQGIGYREPLDYLSGRLDYEEFVEKLKMNTRHFAKRQLTWLRKEPDVDFINKGDFACQADIIDYMKEKCINDGII